jgi:hypothetical protein
MGTIPMTVGAQIEVGNGPLSDRFDRTSDRHNHGLMSNYVIPITPPYERLTA